MVLNMTCHWEYKPLFKKDLFPHLLMMENTYFVQRCAHTYTVCGSASNKLQFMMYPSIVTVKGIVKRTIQRHNSVPSLLWEGPCILSNLCKRTQLPILACPWLLILFLKHKIYLRDKVKIDIVIRIEAFRKKINEKTDIWVESNNNSPASNNFVPSSLGSKTSASNYIGYSTNI